MILYLYGKNSTAESLPSATQILRSVAQSQNMALEGIPTYNKNHINVTNPNSCLTYQDINGFYLKPLNKTACLHIFHWTIQLILIFWSSSFNTLALIAASKPWGSTYDHSFLTEHMCMLQS